MLVTDHKPLTTILGEKKGIPPMAAARFQRWELKLSAYTYEIEFRRRSTIVSGPLPLWPFPKRMAVFACVGTVR